MSEPEDHFGEAVAAEYDETSDAMFDPAAEARLTDGRREGPHRQSSPAFGRLTRKAAPPSARFPALIDAPIACDNWLAT